MRNLLDRVCVVCMGLAVPSSRSTHIWILNKRKKKKKEAQISQDRSYKIPWMVYLQYAF